MNNHNQDTERYNLKHLIETSDFENALIILNSLLDKESNNAEWNYLKAFCLLRLGKDLERSLYHFGIAEINGFHKFWIRYHRGILYAKLGKTELAVRDLEQALTVRPKHKETIALLTNLKERRHTNIKLVKPPVRNAIVLKQPVIISSVPKCGTHLLVNILLHIFGSNNIHGYEEQLKTTFIDNNYLNTQELSNKIYIGHIWYSDELSNKIKKIPKIVLIRDPRDYVVSYAHFYDNFNNFDDDAEKFLQKLKPEDKLSSVILGVTTANGIISPVYDTFVNHAIKWVDSNCMVVRYEDLVSTTPGKIEETTIKVIKSILQFIVPDTLFNSDIVNDILSGSDPSISLTFRKGKVGKWKEEFNQLHIKQFKIAAPSLLSSLGYEKDEDWDLNEKPQANNKLTINSSTKLPSRIKNVFDKYQELNQLPHSDKLKQLIDVWAINRFMDIYDYEKSLPILNRLLEKDPNNGYWNYLKAFCLLTLNKDLDKSLNHFDIAEQNGYDKYWIRFNRGHIHAKLGRTKLAIKELEQALTLEPKDKGTLTLLNNLKNNSVQSSVFILRVKSKLLKFLRSVRSTILSL